MAWSRRGFMRAGAGGVAAGSMFGVRAFAGGDTGDTSDTGAVDPSSDAPNILYIYTDQLRWDALACFGHPVTFSPNIDAFAAESVRFQRCYTTSPLCRPARLSMVTGMYPHQHGVMNNTSPEVIPSEVTSHVRTLRALGGYHTALVGKAHLHTEGGHMDEWIGLMRDWGYDEVMETPGEFKSRVIDSVFTDALTAMTPPDADDLAGVHRDFLNTYQEEWHRFKEWETSPIDAAPWGLGLEHHIDTFVADTVADWFHTVGRDKPWYMQCNFPGPHPPWNAPSPYLDPYLARLDEIPLGTLTEPPRPWSDLVRLVQSEVGIPRSLEQLRMMRAKYLARVTMLDELVGRVLTALDESGQADNTWVVLSSDHGEMMGDHMLVGKIVFFEPSVRIPLMIRPPRGTPFRPFTSRALTDQMDVISTIVDLSGVADLVIEGGPDGTSLKSRVLNGPDHVNAHRGRDQVFSEVYDHAMILDGRHKVVVNEVTMEAVELYDLRFDPTERANLVGTPDYAEVQLAAVEGVATRLGG